ncbi:GNAT family N-acetyltransferase [Neobacillus sp. D3-1R]|uniref:GNAT family N-acetyltransferase n=1 Tax=Neobacillus sp. D3-1R TaxID=3445778 RepID=UPI003FA19058
MNKVIETIQIVQYHEGLAKGIAKMWNLSRDGWGGDTRVMTEEQVKKKEANSDNIVLYLAVNGEEVVGYCGLSEYKEDTGSLYIPLLNVRPDYHGQKIGKKLVLKAIEKTIELGWPRLDLYTWPGNTKAVPLYKKCGFFWEDRDNTTHLMNFIPQIMNTPLLAPVFKELDWYGSSVRKIEVKPDGIKQNGFTFYEYEWKKDHTFARVQMERTGRGISLIETDEYLLQIQLNDHELIENTKQTFQIKLLNKTNTPITFKASGSGHDRIEYCIEAEAEVIDEAVLTSEMLVKSGDEPNPWRTHPVVSVKVSLDGRECELKLGVFPEQPAKIKASYIGNVCPLNKMTTIELEVKNNFRDDAEYLILLPENDQIIFEENELAVMVAGKGQKTLSIPITVKKHGFFNPQLHVKARRMDGTKLAFEQKISIAFKGIGERFGGESLDYWHIYNGLSQVNVRKRDLIMTIGKNTATKQPFAILPARLGKPYANEFTKKNPESVTWEVEASSILLTIHLASDEMEGIQVIKKVQLFADGIVNYWIEVKNQGSAAYETVALCLPIYHELRQTYFPLNDKIVYFSENRPLEFGDIQPSSISGNWYFSENVHPIGVSWSPSCNAAPEGWQFVIEDELGSLQPGECKETNKLFVSFGTFTNWEEFVTVATNNDVIKKLDSCNELSVELNDIVVNSDSNLSLSLNTYRNSYLDGNLTVSVNENEMYKTHIDADEEKTSHSFELPLKTIEPLGVLKGTFKARGMTTNIEEIVISPTNTSIKHHIAESDSFQTVSVSNGCITLKAAPDFYPGLYSMDVNGSEWMDHSFPHTTAKSWWNPWVGGMKTIPSDLTTFSLLKEKTTSQFIEKVDQQGNKWSGLSLVTEINEHAGWKGVHFVQYYLMLPGVPVLTSFIEVLQTGGKNLHFENWVTDLFVGGEDLTNLFIAINRNEQTKQYHAGVQEVPIHIDLDSYLSSTSKGDHFYFVPSLYSEGAEVYTNKEAVQVLSTQPSIPGENSNRTAPFFLVFDKRILTTNLLQKLRKIQF